MAADLTPHLNPIRHFNKRVYNPLMMKLLAGRFIYSVVQHIGRKSGKQYQTPVVAVRCGEYLVAPLPYGSGTDWCQNLVAAQGGKIQKEGVLYQVREPTIISADAAAKLYPPYWRFMFGLFHIEKALRMKLME